MVFSNSSMRGKSSSRWSGGVTPEIRQKFVQTDKLPNIMPTQIIFGYDHSDTCTRSGPVLFLLGPESSSSVCIRVIITSCISRNFQQKSTKAFPLPHEPPCISGGRFSDPPVCNSVACMWKSPSCFNIQTVFEKMSTDFIKSYSLRSLHTPELDWQITKPSARGVNWSFCMRASVIRCQ